jgi:hypothetical protein
MKTGGGKTKGGAFERYCCKRLSVFVTKGARDDIFWRSAMSGGRATLQLRDDIINRAQSGDMTAIAPEGYDLCNRCLFEYKSYADLDIPQGFLKGTGLLHKFWRDTQRAALLYKKLPVLIAKQNYLPPVVLCATSLSFFRGLPIMTVHPWEADVYLFEGATQIIRRPQGKAVNARVHNRLSSSR